MAKQYKGYKGKVSSKIIATGVTAGVLSLAIFGGSIFTTIANKLSNRPIQPEHPYDSGVVDTDTGNASTNPVIKEPSIETEPNYGDFNPEVTLPDLQEPVIPDINDEPIVMDAQYTDVLAKLTAMSKDYIASVTGKTPNVTVTGIGSLNINSNNGEILLLGQLNVGTSFNNFIADITNPDTSLDIYNLSSDSITETDLINGLYEALNDENTQLQSFKMEANKQLSNQAEVIDGILQTRLNDLIALNSTEEAVTKEIAHIKSLLQDTSKLKLSVTRNNCTQDKNGYHYSFTTTVHTGKYVYDVEHILNSTKYLGTSALKQAIEEYLDTVVDYTVCASTSSVVNQTLYIKNQTNEANATVDEALTK